MLIITICVGSSCSLRGSDELASELFRLINKEKLEGLVDIAGAFCMDTCTKGVSVRVGDLEFSGIGPDQADAFFYKEVLPRVENKFASDTTNNSAAMPASGKAGPS
jgi:NADH:ubiquinone oxidoreductase subunit E